MLFGLIIILRSSESEKKNLIIKLPQKKLFVKNLKKIYRKIKFHKFNNFPFLE